ncbi:MAG: hypothetical protein DRH20_15355, partial [Deltaproteobacteria bacterium]
TGDHNPLWLDEDYAKRGIHRGIIAPPFFLTAVSEGQAIIGLPGLVSTFVGAEWEWHRVIRVDDRFTVSNRLLELEDKGGPDGRRRFLQSGILSYVNQRQETVGTCTWHMMRTERKLGGGEKGRRREKDSGIRIHRYSDEELEAICSAVEAEEIRGAAPRWYETVAVGDELVPVVKGPLSLSDMVAWAIGAAWHRIALAHGPKLLHLRSKPGLSYKDPETGAPEPISLSHFHPAAAEILMGSPLPLDLGFQRICWFGHLVTNWMSDHGFLRKLNARLEAFVRFGDTNWCRGKIVKKWVDGKDHLVEMELHSENQRGEITMTGNAVVALPSKENSEPER